MKALYQIIAIMLAATSLTNSSCRKGGDCEGSFNLNQSEVAITFIDQQNGSYIYSETNPGYNKDSLKVFDPQGNSLIILSALNQIPNSNNRYYVLSFGNIYNPLTDAASFNSEICKEYTIKYSTSETDTLSVCFKSKQTKCGSVFETLKVYHKGQLLDLEANKTSTLINVYKN